MSVRPWCLPQYASYGLLVVESLSMTETAFWKQPAAALLAELGTPDGGLTSREAALRLLRYGSNDAAAPKRSPAWLRFIRLLANPLVIILLVASALSAATGDVASFVIIASIVLLSVLLDFAQASQAQNAVDALRQQVALRADVRRDGAEASLPVAQLVPGDIVRLTAGDMVPADGVLLSSRDFFVNQALLTGESFPVEKHAAEHGDPATEISEAGNVALAGTSVIAGSAVQLICQTGRRTTLGQLADTLIAKPPPTSFEIGLRRFSMLILRITLVLVLLVMAESMAFHRPWIDALIFALALAVGLTPELLPMIMTVTLARGAVRLSHQRVIVKSLPAIHNLGAMDVLCTDKTGTLTEARIALTRHVDIADNDSERVLTLAWLNSHFESGLKSPLDDAILAHGTIDPSPWRKIDEVPFDFERRRVSVLVERDGVRTLILKGAPEDVMRICTSVEMPDGTSQVLTDELRAKLQARFDQLSAQGFRLLGIASRAEPPDQAKAVLADEKGLTFAGFAVFLDPPKVSASAALAALAAAGVAVKVLTGDNEQVARHLCGELGFDPGKVLTGTRTGGTHRRSIDRASGRNAAVLSCHAAAEAARDHGAKAHGPNGGLSRRRHQRRPGVACGGCWHLRRQRRGRGQGGGGDHPAGAGSGRGARGGDGGTAHDRQHRQIHPDGQQRQFRKHIQHGSGRADPALPPAPANSGAVDQPDLRLRPDRIAVGQCRSRSH